MKQADLTIIAMGRKGVITAWIRGYPGIIVQGRDEEDVRYQLFNLLAKHFEQQLNDLVDAPYNYNKVLWLKDIEKEDANNNEDKP